MLSMINVLIYRIAISLLCLLVVSCSSKTEVHLFTAHLNEKQASDVVNQLSQHNFKVQINELPFPESINSNTLVYAPTANENDSIKEMLTILSKLGYNLASTNLIFEENHSFTLNNVGLYLLPEGYVKPTKRYKIKLLNEYGSTTCEHATNLYLNEENRFFIEINEWNEQKKQYQEMNIAGHWSINDMDDILLTSENWSSPLKFHRQQSIENTKNGPRQVVSLLPKNEQISKIQSLVNCIYTISVVL